MLTFILNYNFLILSLLFLLPGIFIYIYRKDLRPMMRILAACSVPFAFTEFLFYPTYWEPRFLWNLINYLGFGLEDLLFVVGLSAFTSTNYAVFFRKKLAPYPKGGYTPMQVILFFMILFIIVISSFVFFKIHLIYGAPILMFGLSVFIFTRRTDLILPGLLGAFLSTLIYVFLCYLLILIYPNIFSLTWHTEKFLNIKILSLPLEELLYATNSGCIATLFYPYVFSYRYVAF
jgi:hypothetical protein